MYVLKWKIKKKSSNCMKVYEWGAGGGEGGSIEGVWKRYLSGGSLFDRKKGVEKRYKDININHKQYGELYYRGTLIAFSEAVKW